MLDETDQDQPASTASETGAGPAAVPPDQDVADAADADPEEPGITDAAEVPAEAERQDPAASPSARLAQLLPWSERFASWRSPGLLLAVLGAWLTFEHLSGAALSVARPVWLTAGTLLAVGLAVGAAPLAGAEQRRGATRGVGKRRRMLVSAVLVLPCLLLVAVLPARLPGLWALPWWSSASLLAASVGSLWLAHGVIRHALELRRGAATGRGEGRWLSRCGRALEAAGGRRWRWRLWSRGEPLMRLEAIAEDDSGLVVQLYVGAARVEASRGHLPRALETQLRESVAARGVELVRQGERAVLLLGGRAEVLGEAAARVSAAWSLRERLGGSSASADEARVSGAVLAAASDGGVREVGGWLRGAAAAACVGALVFVVARHLVVFPVWEGAPWLVAVLGGLGVVAALLQAWPSRSAVGVSDRRLGAALREVLDLLWALGAPAGEAQPRVVGGGAGQWQRRVVVETPVLSAELTLWVAGGGWLGEHLVLEARDESGLGGIGLVRLRRALAGLGWAHEVSGERRLVVSSRRMVGSGRGAWRELAWRVADEGVLLGAERPASRVVADTRVPPGELVARRGRAGWWRRLRPLASALLLGVFGLGLPRVGTDAFEQEGAAAGELAVAERSAACPEAGASVYESLRALRCVASASGQSGRRLESLDWSRLMAPVATAVSEMTEVGALGARATCEEVGERMGTLGARGTLMRANAILARYRAETWGRLRFFWPSAVVRDGRSLAWSEVERALKRCQGVVDASMVEEARRLYELSGRAFAGMYGGR